MPRSTLLLLAAVLALNAASASATQVVYLNFDGAQGAYAVGPGPNNRIKRTDSSVPRWTAIPPYVDSSPAARAASVNTIARLVAGYYGDMDVRFTLSRPAGGDYTEAIIGGDVKDIMPHKGDVAGAAPIDAGNRSANDLVFVFTGKNGRTDSPEWFARVIAHELAHSFGLVHTTGALAAAAPSDLMCESAECMTAGRWTFKYTSHPPKYESMSVEGSYWGGQDSYKLLMETLGARRP
jgi:hypothetical protein